MPAKRRKKTQEELVQVYETRISELCDRVEQSGLRIRQACELAFSAAKDIPPGKWNVLSAMGKLLAAYEARFHASFKASTVMQWEVYEKLSDLMLQFGAMDVVEGVDVIFSPDMKWVDTPVWKFLNASFFTRHVVPRVHQARIARPGEQAEAMSLDLEESRVVGL